MTRTLKGPRGTGITWMAAIGVSILASTLHLSGAPAVTSASVRSAFVEETARPSANKVGVATQRIIRDETQIDGATRTQDAEPPRLSDTARAPATHATVASATPASALKAVISAARQAHATVASATPASAVKAVISAARRATAKPPRLSDTARAPATHATVASATPASAVKVVISAARQATAAPPSIHLVALPSLKVDVLNARERYFSVSGRTPALILASARRNVPSDPSGNDRDSMAYVGPIVWKHLPSYVMDPSSGACTMTGVTSSTRYQATLPQWTSPSKVPAELLAWWRVVLRHIGQHESGHIRIFARYVRALPSRVVGQPCSKWQAKVTAWSADLARAQANFDAAEARWVFPKYIGPKNW